MITYAGIGSREITDKETILIEKISSELSKKFIVFSGNAPGSDQAFQRGSNGKCILFLPWKNFINGYNMENCIKWFDVGNSKEGLASVPKYHDNVKKLTPNGGMKLMARNYHQIMGYDIYPKVSFVVYCASRKENGDIKGGTGQAVKIAKDLNIPTINIRDAFWKEDLKAVIEKVLKNNMKVI